MCTSMPVRLSRFHDATLFVWKVKSAIKCARIRRQKTAITCFSPRRPRPNLRPEDSPEMRRRAVHKSNLPYLALRSSRLQGISRGPGQTFYARKALSLHDREGWLLAIRVKDSLSLREAHRP